MKDLANDAVIRWYEGIKGIKHYIWLYDADLDMNEALIFQTLLIIVCINIKYQIKAW